MSYIFTFIHNDCFIGSSHWLFHGYKTSWKGNVIQCSHVWKGCWFESVIELCFFCGMFYLVPLLDDFFYQVLQVYSLLLTVKGETVLRMSCHNSWDMSLWVNFLEGLLCFPIKRGCFPFWQGDQLFMCVCFVVVVVVKQGILSYLKGNESVTIMTVLFSKRLTTGRRK